MYHDSYDIWNKIDSLQLLVWVSLVFNIAAILIGISVACTIDGRAKLRIQADKELIQSLYYTLAEQEIACDEAIQKAQVSCVD